MKVKRMDEKRLWYELSKISLLFEKGHFAKTEAAETMMDFLKKPSKEDIARMELEDTDDDFRF